MEKFLISSIGIENLCNQTLGGEGAFGLKHSDETKRKLSEANKGRIISAETKAKISAKSKGHPNYNLSHTDEAKAKITQYTSRFILSEPQLLIISLDTTGRLAKSSLAALKSIAHW